METSDEYGRQSSANDYINIGMIGGSHDVLSSEHDSRDGNGGDLRVSASSYRVGQSVWLRCGVQQHSWWRVLPATLRNNNRDLTAERGAGSLGENVEVRTRRCTAEKSSPRSS